MAMNPKDLLVWIKSLSRGQALPLDASEVHESFEDAQEYANTAIAYGGQTVKVKLDDGKYHEYILQPSDDGYRLEEIRGGGSAGIHVGDESSMPEGTVLHIDPDGEGYEMLELDTTLSKAGYAADANVTGKKIDELHERLDDVEQSGGTSIDEIYILGEEETVEDAPDTAKEIIDPYDDAKPVDLGQFATKEDLRELSGEIGDKADKAGWTPEKYIGTDENGNLIEKDAPAGGGGWTIDGLTAETAIADDDTLPFYDTSAKEQRKTLWSNIKTVLKTYFDTVYMKLSGGTLSGKIVLPTDNQNVGFTNSGDVKIFGYGNINSVSHLRIGDATRPVQLRGSTERPKYNNDELVLKTELDAALGSYITDIDALIGGDE